MNDQIKVAILRLDNGHVRRSDEVHFVQIPFKDTYRFALVDYDEDGRLITATVESCEFLKS